MSTSAQSQRSAWLPTLTAIALVLAWVGYWYGDTLGAMAQIWWRAETYTHGLVVPPIALWLIWRNRKLPAAMQPRASYWLAIPLATFVFLWLLGDLTAVNALAQFAVIGVIVSTIMSMVGLPISRQLAFPLIFLFFAVPVGDFLLPILMEWTADFTVQALRLTGIPVFREGQNFVIPSGQWSVIEACSGVRYLIASLTVGTLFAYLTYTSLKRRLLFIVVALLVPILANWLRAYLIVLLGHLSGNKLAAGVDHLIYGWVFFGIVITIMFAIGMRWAEPPLDGQAATPDLLSKSAIVRFRWSNALVIALIIAAGPLAESYLRKANAQVAVQLSPPDTNETWPAKPIPIDWKPRFGNSSAETLTAYAFKESWVGLYIAYYRNQNFDSKLVTSTNVLAGSNDPDWHVVTSQSAELPWLGSTRRIRMAELAQKTIGRDDHYVVWQSYWINGHLTSSDIEAKWLTAWAMLTGHGDDGAVIIVYAPKAVAAEALPAFTKDFGEAIVRHLAEAASK